MVKRRERSDDGCESRMVEECEDATLEGVGTLGRVFCSKFFATTGNTVNQYNERGSRI